MAFLSVRIYWRLGYEGWQCNSGNAICPPNPTNVLIECACVAAYHCLLLAAEKQCTRQKKSRRQMWRSSGVVLTSATLTCTREQITLASVIIVEGVVCFWTCGGEVKTGISFPTCWHPSSCILYYYFALFRRRCCEAANYCLMCRQWLSANCAVLKTKYYAKSV